MNALNDVLTAAAAAFVLVVAGYALLAFLRWDRRHVSSAGRALDRWRALIGRAHPPDENGS